MMARLPEFTESDYRGSSDWSVAEGRLPSAIAAVRDAMGFNVPRTEEQAEAYRDAVNAALEVDAAHGFSGGIADGASLTIGSFSVGAAQAGPGSYRYDMAHAISRALAGSGLLYQGIG